MTLWCLLSCDHNVCIITYSSDWKSKKMPSKFGVRLFRQFNKTRFDLSSSWMIWTLHSHWNAPHASSTGMIEIYQCWLLLRTTARVCIACKINWSYRKTAKKCTFTPTFAETPLYFRTNKETDRWCVAQFERRITLLRIASLFKIRFLS